MKNIAIKIGTKEEFKMKTLTKIIIYCWLFVIVLFVTVIFAIWLIGVVINWAGV